ETITAAIQMNACSTRIQGFSFLLLIVPNPPRPRASPPAPPALVPAEPLLPYRTPCGVAALRPTPTSCALALEAGRNPRAEQPEHEGGQRRDKQIRGVSLGSFGTQTVDDFLDALVLLIARAVGGALE